MNATLAKVLKGAVTLGLLFGIGGLISTNTQKKKDLQATNENVSMLKIQAQKPIQKKKATQVTNSDYTDAEKSGKAIATEMTNQMKDPNNKKNPAAPKSQVIEKFDNRKTQLENISPYLLPNGHVDFAHGGNTSDGQIISSFLIYDDQNQLQGIISATYDPQTHKFDNYKLTQTEKLISARNSATNNQI